MTKGIIFDLDGVIVSTDEYHYQAWKTLADEEGIAFDRAINERLRGVSRMESLEIILEKASRSYTQEEKVAMAERKNRIYQTSLKNLTAKDLLPGVKDALTILRKKGLKLAIGSSSKNSPLILKQIALESSFDACADGNQIQHSKPDPEVFLLAAEKMGFSPAECLVVEDAESGVEAAINGGMEVLAIGSASSDQRATYRAKDLSQVVWVL